MYIERNDLKTKESIIRAMVASRTAAQISQREMAKKISRSVNTVSNWENGIGEPSISEFIEWHLALDINPLRALLNAFYPEDFECLDSDSVHSQVVETLATYICEVAPADELRKLSYNMFGETGSEWKAQLEMWTAYNHLTLKSKVFVASLILSSFNIEKERGELQCVNEVMPDLDLLSDAIKRGTNSTVDNKNSYA